MQLKEFLRRTALSRHVMHTQILFSGQSKLAPHGADSAIPGLEEKEPPINFSSWSVHTSIRRVFFYPNLDH